MQGVGHRGAGEAQGFVGAGGPVLGGGGLQLRCLQQLIRGLPNGVHKGVSNIYNSLMSSDPWLLCSQPLSTLSHVGHQYSG